MPEKRSRNYMGVVYNYDSGSHHHNFNDAFHSYGDMLTSHFNNGQLNFIKYMVFGKETCPTTGTPHLQCFFILKNPLSMKGFHKKLEETFGIPSTIALKEADANIDECIKYCCKDGDATHLGEKPKGKGSRTDLNDVANMVLSGATLHEIATVAPTEFIKFSSGISKLIQFTTKPRDFKTKVYWCYGTTGTGKSRWCMENMERENSYSKNGQTKWWDGYYGQKDVLIDDYRPNKEMNFGYMLNLMDRFPMIVEAKGQTTHFVSHRIFITAPLAPRELFMEISDGKWSNDAIDQFERRITKILHFTPMQSGIGYENLDPPSPPEKNVWTHTVTQTAGTVNTNQQSIVDPPPQLIRQSNTTIPSDLDIYSSDDEYISKDRRLNSSSSSIDLT